jgi:predicted phage-related endonuclease
MLSPQRTGLTTASMAPVIIHGSNTQRHQLWLERTGQAEPEDLSNVFPVQWGKHNETFVLDWVERTTQLEITERGRFIRHPMRPQIGCTLDGYRPHDDAVVECKVVSPFSEARTASGEPGFLDWYAPQVVTQMHCRPAARGWLCVQQGNSAPQLHEVERDETYEAFVINQLMQFHRYVELREPPHPPPPAPVPAERWRMVDLDAASQENWIPAIKPHLDVWCNTRATAKAHDQAKADIKLLLPGDIGRASYGNIRIRRSKNGAITIEERAA